MPKALAKIAKGFWKPDFATQYEHVSIVMKVSVHWLTINYQTFKKLLSPVTCGVLRLFRLELIFATQTI